MRDSTQTLRTTLEHERGILLAFVFGSVAAGTARIDSDIDIAVLKEQPLSAAEKAGLIEKIADITGRPVDLIDLRTVGEPLLGEIFKGKRIAGSDEQHARLLTRHLLDVADFLPLQQRILKERRDQWIK
jgi:predicted nucleotidyltransferase